MVALQALHCEGQGLRLGSGLAGEPVTVVLVAADCRRGECVRADSAKSNYLLAILEIAGNIYLRQSRPQTDAYLDMVPTKRFLEVLPDSVLLFLDEPFLLESGELLFHRHSTRLDCTPSA